MEDKEYFSTAEFAKLANISKQTLIYYDKSNIFSPIYKDENGFRYYSLGQFEALDTLIALRDIGVPLKEIKEYLRNKSIESLADLLKKKNELVNEQIHKLKLISSKIENKSLKLEKAIEEQYITEPSFKSCDSTHILTSNINSDDCKKIMMEITKFIIQCKNNEDFDNGNSIGGIISKEDIHNGNFNKIKDVYIVVDRKIEAESIQVKPKGIYACINHKGGYDTTYISYNKLIGFIKKNGYEIVGDGYENELIGYLSARSQEEYLIEISIEVQKLGQKIKYEKL